MNQPPADQNDTGHHGTPATPQAGTAEPGGPAGMSKEQKQRVDALAEASAVPDDEVGRPATPEDAPKSTPQTGNLAPSEAARPAVPPEEEQTGMTGEQRAEALSEASAVPDAEGGR